MRGSLLIEEDVKTGDMGFDEKQSVLQEVKTKKLKYLAVLLVLGLLNNIGYVFINSSAQSLGQQFDETKLMSLFTFCTTALSIVTCFVNSKYLLKVRHFTKIQIMLICYTISYLAVGISNLMTSMAGFFLCLFGCLVMGIATTLGEQTNLGFLKGFAPELISGWGCGTGLAGVFGAGINFVLRYFGVPGYIIFLAMIPTNLIYLFGFMWLKNQKVHQIEKKEHELGSSHSFGEGPNSHKDGNEAAINQTLSVRNFKLVWPNIWFLCFNLASVYFLEYGIISGFADPATDQWTVDPNTKSLHHNAFVLLNFCYQLGVVISRTSLVCFKIKQIWVVTVLQFINYILWAWIGYYKLVPIGWYFPLMVWVGLMGGASYVNVIYQTLETDQVEKKDKEIALNILSIFNNFGILMTTLLFALFAETIYADK